MDQPGSVNTCMYYIHTYIRAYVHACSYAIQKGYIHIALDRCKN